MMWMNFCQTFLIFKEIIKKDPNICINKYFSSPRIFVTDFFVEFLMKSIFVIFFHEIYKLYDGQINLSDNLNFDINNN